jgi:DNA mismatch repair protein MutS
VEIVSRLQALELLVEDEMLLKNARQVLSSATVYGDAERALQRLSLAVHKTPLQLARDLRAVCLSILLCGDLKTAVPLSCERWSGLAQADRLIPLAERILQFVGREDEDEMEGVLPGVDALLDKLRDGSRLRQQLSEYEQRLTQTLHIPLKVQQQKTNQSIYFEVPKQYGEKMSKFVVDFAEFEIRYVGQRTHNTRWTTDELEAMGSQVFNREREISQRTFLLLQQCREQLMEEFEKVKTLFHCLFDFDLSVGVARAATGLGLHVPQIVEDAEGNDVVHLNQFFHPILKHVQGGSITKNDVALDSEQNRVMILTGANMSGKSSVLRAGEICFFFF